MVQQKQAFTLIELLVVVLIIGILAAVAVPQYQKAVYKARAVEAITLLKSITDAQEVYFLENVEYTDDISELDIDVAVNLMGSAKFEDKYSFFCGGKRTCFATVNNRSMPTFEFELLHDRVFPINAGKKYCHIYNGSKDNIALSICKSLGKNDTDGVVSTGKYFILN